MNYNNSNGNFKRCIPSKDSNSNFKSNDSWNKNVNQTLQQHKVVTTKVTHVEYCRCASKMFCNACSNYFPKSEKKFTSIEQNYDYSGNCNDKLKLYTNKKLECFNCNKDLFR